MQPILSTNRVKGTKARWEERPVRLLLVDDDEEDYRFTCSLLRRIEDSHFSIEWVQRAEDALPRLRAGGWDACLMDYRLRRLTGLEILRKARAEGITAPVILLTGQGDRSLDQEALATGASDFLVKGEIAPATLERSLRYSIAHCRVEESLLAQKEFTDAILDTASTLVLVLDSEECIIRFNRACEHTTGYREDEVRGKRVQDTIFPATENESVLLTGITASDGDRQTAQLETQLRTKNGKRRRIVWRTARLMDQHGQSREYFVCVGTDVTEQRIAEESLAAARQREVEVGANIQSSLLVRQPPTDFPELSFSAYSQPSQRIDGDFFDFFQFKGGILDVLVGDVMGKGVAAALLAAAAKSQFQRVMRHLTLSMRQYGRLPQPHEVVTAIHKLLTPELQRLNYFVTLKYARFDMHHGTMTLVDCGAPPLLHWYAASGKCLSHSGDNLPIGIQAMEVYRQHTVMIAPGDTLLFYSDGVTDAYNAAADEYFGVERLQEVALRNGSARPETLITSVLDAIGAFVDDIQTATFDDLTCLAIRVEQTHIPLLRVHRAQEFTSAPQETIRIRAWIADLLQNSFPMASEEEMLLIEVGLIEAFGNIVKHAYQNQHDRPVYIEAEIYPAKLRLRLLDWGEITFSPEAVVAPAFDGAVSGYGFYILRQSYDEVEFGSDELGRNTLLLTKHFAGPMEDGIGHARIAFAER